MRSGIIGLLAAGAIGFYLPASASIIMLPTSFTAPEQSMWGSGSSASFRATGSGSLGPFGYGYDFGASSGTVSALFQGGISVDYTPKFNYRDPASTINLSFVGNTGGGQIKSDFGALAKVDIAGFSVLDLDYGLNIDHGFAPQLGQQVSGSDSATLGNAGVNIIVASAGVNFNIVQTDEFNATSINGLLVASRRGGSTSLITPFNLTGSGLTLDLGLNDFRYRGTWDIAFIDLMLGNQFSTSFDATLQPYVTYVSGIRFCSGVFGIRYPCDVDRSTYEITLAAIDVYDGEPFSLKFNSITSLDGFSIQVIPEPATLTLLGIGLLGLAGLRRTKVRS